MILVIMLMCVEWESDVEKTMTTTKGGKSQQRMSGWTPPRYVHHSHEDITPKHTNLFDAPSKPEKEQREEPHRPHFALAEAIHGIQQVSVAEEFTKFEDIEQDAAEIVAKHNATMFDGVDIENTASIGGNEEDDYKRLSNTLFRAILYLKVSGIVDTSCYINRWWMPETLRRIKLVHGRYIYYYCVDTQYTRVREEVSPRMKGLNRVFFVKRNAWNEILPNADMLLGWETLQSMSVSRFQNFTNNMHRTSVKYVMLTDNPDVANTEEAYQRGYRRKNLRKEPFNFPQPLREWSGLSDVKKKHLLLYRAEDLPSFLLEEETTGSFS